MRGHLRERGKRTWAIVLDIGKGPDGKRRQKWHTFHGTKKQAEAELSRLLNDMNTGAYVEPSKMTLGEYLDRWLEDYARVNVSGKTFERYAEIVRIHLKPALGQVLLSKLTPLDIQECYSKALTGGRKDGRGGLSPRTVLQHHRVLREALNQAVRWQLLPRNPADAVEPPRYRGKEMQVLDEEQVSRLMEAAAGSHLYMPLLLAVTTGMRRGEILAIRWQDVDLARGLVSVRRSLEQTGGGLAFKEPKTAKGRRVISLPGIAVDTLRCHRAEQESQLELLGAELSEADLVCAYPDGRPIQPDNLYSAFKTILRRAGLPEIRFHDLRHTHATILLQHGVHPKVVSERLGHASIGITLDTYSHVLPNMQEEAARKLDGALRGLRQVGEPHEHLRLPKAAWTVDAA